MKYYGYAILIMLLSSGLSHAQNTTIPWSTFNMGFAEAMYQNTSVKSAVGYPFVGTSEDGGTSILSGFLADTLFRPLAPAYSGPIYAFEKTYGGGAYDIAYSLQQTSDSGFVLAGETYSFGEGQRPNTHIVKVKANGEVMWTTTPNIGTEDLAYSLKQTTDGGYILGGFRSIPNTAITDPFIMKTNVNGDTVWTKQYGYATGGSINALNYTADGGYVGAGRKGGDIYLLRIDASGNEIWSRTFNSSDDYGTSVQQTSDGGFIVLGWSADAYIRYVNIIKANDTGGVQWTKYIGETNSFTFGNSVQQTIDGGYIIGGSTSPGFNTYPGAFLFKINENGDSVWAKTFKDNYHWSATSVRQTMDGGYILTGSKYDPGPQISDVFLLKTDAFGDSLWTKIFGGAGDDVGYSVVQTIDGGFAVAGKTNSSGNGLYDFFFVKTDGDGILRTTLSQEFGQKASWNMLSVPLVVNDYRKTSLFPTAVSPAYAYLPTGYAAKDTMEDGVGYWLKFSSDQTVRISGSPRSRDTIDVTQGWNMIGVPSTISPTSQVEQIGTTVLTNYFGYASAGGYFSEDSLQPGYAYWVKVDQAGKLIVKGLSSAITPSAAILIKTGGYRERNAQKSIDPLKELNTLAIRDARSNEQILYFSTRSTDINLNEYQLPPLPPHGIMDARYESNRMVELSEKEKSKTVSIVLSSAVYPITVEWKMIDARASATLLLDDNEMGIVGNGETRITNPESIIQLRLSPSSSLELPKQSALHQNFPNPFNPATQIRYELPEQAHVKLVIYNVLGQQVRSLIDEVQEAGFKSVAWNASGVASGVYFYRLVADKFTDVKKLMVIK